MSYFEFTDLEKWKTVNERPYLGKGTTTTQLLRIKSKPDSDPAIYAVEIRPADMGKIGKHLTSGEAIILTDGLSETINPPWQDWT